MMMEEGATNAQTGHFYVQNQPQSDSQGDNLYVLFVRFLLLYLLMKSLSKILLLLAA